MFELFQIHQSLSFCVKLEFIFSWIKLSQTGKTTCYFPPVRFVRPQKGIASTLKMRSTPRKARSFSLPVLGNRLCCLVAFSFPWRESRIDDRRAVYFALPPKMSHGRIAILKAINGHEDPHVILASLYRFCSEFCYEFCTDRKWC